MIPIETTQARVERILHTKFNEEKGQVRRDQGHLQQQNKAVYQHEAGGYKESEIEFFSNRVTPGAEVVDHPGTKPIT